MVVVLAICNGFKAENFDEQSEVTDGHAIDYWITSPWWQEKEPC